MTREVAQKRCKATTRAGKPCTAWPLKGGKFCLAHSDAVTRASVRFTPEAGKLGGRPAVPKATDIQRQLVEDNILVLWSPHFAALGYRIVFGGDGRPELETLPGGGAMLHGTSQRSGEIVMSEYADLAARQAAAERLLDTCAWPAAAERGGNGGWWRSDHAAPRRADDAGNGTAGRGAGRTHGDRSCERGADVSTSSTVHPAEWHI